MGPFVFPDIEDELPLPERWLLESQAFVESSLQLLTDLESGAFPPTFSRVKAAAFMFVHGVELFLKGALALGGALPPGSHKLQGLLGRYRSLYKGTQFDFTCRVSELANAPGDRPWEHFLKYPANLSGKAWPGGVHFRVDIWREQAQAMLTDHARLAPLLRAASKPTKTP